MAGEKQNDEWVREPGQEKTENHFLRLLKSGLRVRVLDLAPDHRGKVDVSDYAAQSGGPALRAALDKVCPLVNG